MNANRAKNKEHGAQQHQRQTKHRRRRRKKTNCTRGNGLNQFVINLLVVICNKIQTNDRANRFATLHFDILEPHHSLGQSQHEQTATIKKKYSDSFSVTN